MSKPPRYRVIVSLSHAPSAAPEELRSASLKDAAAYAATARMRPGAEVRFLDELLGRPVSGGDLLAGRRVL